MSEHRNYILGRDEENTRGELMEGLMDEYESETFQVLSERVEKDARADEVKGYLKLAGLGKEIAEILKKLASGEKTKDKALKKIAKRIVDMNYGNVCSFFTQRADHYDDRNDQEKKEAMLIIAQDFQKMRKISAPHTAVIGK